MKIINVDITCINDLIERYDNNAINNNLIQFLIKKSYNIKKNEQIKIIINNKCNTKLNLIDKIKESLEKELINCMKVQDRINILKFILFLTGVFFLVLATFMKSNIIWNQILVIIGWVPIWKLTQLELFNNYKRKKKKQIIRKLLNSNIEIIKKENLQ